MNTPQQHPDDLLPWYVNGTLTGDELSAVENHVQQCEHCQQEVEFLRLLREQVKQEGKTSHAGELTKQRFLNQIRQETAGTKKSWWMPALAVAACLVIVVQAGMLISRPGTGIDPDTIKLQGKRDADIKVKFKKTASVTDISQLLQKFDAKIVWGPSAGDHYYDIKITSISDKDRPKDKGKQQIAKIVKQLKANTKLVIYAGTIGGSD